MQIPQLAIYSLAWFIVGLIAARQLPPPVGVKKPSRGSSRGGNRGKNPREARTGRKPSSTRNGAAELYVGNLPYEISDKELSKVFEPYGRVVSIRLIENRSNGKSKGFGFVEMDSPQAAEAAIKELNSTKVQGRSIVVSTAKSQARRRGR